MTYACAVCRADGLTASPTAYTCGACGRQFPVIAGIPDFRIYPFRYSKDEGADVAVLLEHYDTCDFVALYALRKGLLVEPGKSPSEKVRELHESSLKRLLDYHLHHADIFSTNLTKFRHVIGPQCVHKQERALELGCGCGTQIADMLSLYDRVVAVDNSLAELILARNLMEEKGFADRVDFAAACSEALPMVGQTFDVVNMRSVLEHVADQDRSLQEIHRVLRRGGILLLETPNRFTLREEPHVKVYGVGFVPRRWMTAYVDFMTRRQITFGGTRSLSYRELRNVLHRTFGECWMLRVRLIDESRAGVTLAGKLYRRFAVARGVVENPAARWFCTTFYVAAWKCI